MKEGGGGEACYQIAKQYECGRKDLPRRKLSIESDRYENGKVRKKN